MNPDVAQLRLYIAAGNRALRNACTGAIQTGKNGTYPGCYPEWFFSNVGITGINRQRRQ